MTQTEWEKGDDSWQRMIAKDAEQARQSQKPPDPQCCFGIAAVHGDRCTNPATRAGTFYGYTTGFSLCAEHAHGNRLDDYPHGEIPIKKSFSTKQKPAEWTGWEI